MQLCYHIKDFPYFTCDILVRDIHFVGSDLEHSSSYLNSQKGNYLKASMN